MKIQRIILVFITVLCANMGFASATDSVTDTKKLPDLIILKVTGNFNIVFTDGKAGEIKIVAPDKDALALVETKGTSTVTINMKEGAKTAVTLYVTLHDIQQLILKVTGTVTSTNTIKADNLTLKIDGDVAVTLSINATYINYTSSSSKAIVLKGKVDKFITFNDDGEGSIDASDLASKEMPNLEDSSDGDLKINVTKNLNLNISGSGTCTIFGKPKDKIIHLKGQATAQQIVDGK